MLLASNEKAAPVESGPVENYESKELSLRQPIPNIHAFNPSNELRPSESFVVALGRVFTELQPIAPQPTSLDLLRSEFRALRIGAKTNREPQYLSGPNPFAALLSEFSLGR
jgi:hypothetical protein